MFSKKCLLLFSSTALIVGPAWSEEKEKSNWEIFGSVLFQGDYRDSRNNFGGFGSSRLDGFVELDTRFSKDIGPYASLSGSTFGAYDQSKFRGVRNGFSAERFYLKYQQGDAVAPYRLELGDFFGFTTLRTLQAPLKGSRLEYQYQPSGSGIFHSGQFHAGSQVSDYHQLTSNQFNDNLHIGYSHLMENDVGSLLLSGGWNQKQVSGQTARAGLFSVAVERGFTLHDHTITAEGEIAVLTGQTINGATIVTDTSLGMFTQITGFSRQMWRYGLRYEDYGKNYRPAGSAITADRRFLEGRIGKRFENGFDAELRLQRIYDGRSTGNTLQTNTAGLNSSWSRIPGLDGVTAFSSLFLRDVRNSNGTINNTSVSGDLTVNWTLSSTSSASTSLSVVNLDSRQANLVGRRTYEAQASVNHRLDFSSVQGTFSPGFVVRHENSSTDKVLSFGPRVALSLLKQGGHSLSLNGTALYRDSSGASPDSLGLNGGMRYSFTKGNHRIGLEADYFANDPNPGAKGEAWRIGANYTLKFASPDPTTQTAADGKSKFVAYRTGKLFVEGFPDLAALAPGSDFATALAKVESAGLGAGTGIGPNWVTDGRFLRGLGQRQRLVLSDNDGVLRKSALVIAFSPGRDANSQSLEFSRILEQLTVHYGVPERSVENGAFVADLGLAVSRGQFRRVVEWRLRGGILRFGIPQRLDGDIRMELQYAASQPNIGDPFWSIEEVR